MLALEQAQMGGQVQNMVTRGRLLPPPCYHLTGNRGLRHHPDRAETSVEVMTGESTNPRSLRQDRTFKQVQCLMLEKQDPYWRLVVVSKSAQDREKRSFLGRVTVATFCFVFTKWENVQNSINETVLACCVGPRETVPGWFQWSSGSTTRGVQK